MELLDKRLRDVGAKNYAFVNLDDGSVAEGLGSHAESIIGTRIDANGNATTIPNTIEHIKTLIWEAVLLVPCQSGSGKTIEEIIDHYFVTALRVEDRVDLTKLYELVRQHTLEATPDELSMQSKRLMLRLAEREMAESLAGFKSGTIPPICHTTSIPLYIDDVITTDEMALGSLGSGTEGYDVYISVKDMLEIAKSTSLAVHVHALSQRKRSSTNLTFSENSFRAKSNKDTKMQIASNAMKSSLEGLQISNTNGIAAKAKLLRTAAKKKGNIEVLRQMLDEIGDEFPSLMEVQEYGLGGIDKNALHIAAWKGDMEAMKLLIDRGKEFGLDLVNKISVGAGNYGKTPVFYSLTQCRGDAVMMLVENGADLLIVNNKGQTPCSIAVSHLTPEICRILDDVEASQIQAGGVFKNYRATHSDRRRYGDLDPRFEIDEDNMGDDLIPQLEKYHIVVRAAVDDAIVMECESDDIRSIVQSTAVPGLPRSIRPTVRHWNLLPHERDENAKAMKASKVQKQPERKSKKAEKQDIVVEDEINYDSLERLSFNNTQIFGNNHLIRVIENNSGIDELCRAIDDSITASSNTNTAKNTLASSDLNFLLNSWGLDAEWQPSHTRGYETPVATLQLHHTQSNSSFLLDVQRLFQSGVADANANLTETERRLSDALTKIFSGSNPILGFGIAMDLGKLAASFPHVPCFRRFENVIDLHSVSRNVYAGSAKSFMSSLQKMVAVLLDKRLDKTEQCSNWENRPLTDSQIDYALLDAAVLPSLLRRMICDDESIVEKYDGKFIYNHPHLCSTTKLICLGGIGDDFSCPPQLAFRVPNGSCKLHLQQVMSRQTWTTGKDEPKPPEKLSTAAQESVALSRRPKEKRSKQHKSDQSVNNGKKVKKKTVKLNKISIDFDKIPHPGTVIDYTKDSCIHELVGEQFLESLKQNNSRLGYNKRGGVLTFENVFCLFVNFAMTKSGSQPLNWLYRNEFLNEGRVMTFKVNVDRDDERTLSDFFRIHRRSNDTKKVLLFSRTGSNTKFMFCGECSCSEQIESGGYINLHLELMDFNKLIEDGENGNTSMFKHMVLTHDAAKLTSS